MRRSHSFRDINFFYQIIYIWFKPFAYCKYFYKGGFLIVQLFALKATIRCVLAARVMFFYEREFQAQCDLYFCCPSVRPYIKTRRCWKVSTFLGPRSKFTPIATSSNHNVINDHNTPNTFQLETCRQLRQGWTRRSCRLFSSLFFRRPWPSRILPSFLQKKHVV